MGSHLLVRLLSVLLRGATLLCKFLLIFFLAKFLEPNDVGLYGLLVATVSYAIFVLGFEFYTYSTRELIGGDGRKWLAMIRDQCVFFIFTYFLFLPFFLMVFMKGWLPWVYASWFFLLLTLEHVAQELNRLLIAMSQPLLASVVLFFRGGAWCLLLVLIMWVNPEMRKLEVALAAWSFGVGFSCLLGIYRVLRLDKVSLGQGINWGWIGRGLKVAVPLLIASLAIRGIFTFDRYWVESIAGLDVLGAYVLFIGIANAVVAFLEAGVIVFLYPKIVAAAKLNDKEAFLDGMKALSWNVFLVTLALVGLVWLLSGYLIDWIGKELYIEGYYLLKWLLLAITLYAVSMIPHVGLYACGQDKSILFSQLCGLAAFCLGVYWGAPRFGVVAVPWALCLSFLLVLIWKLIAYCSMRNCKSFLV
ncbi:hypothetical protein PSH28_26630 [Pseudomonas resinovorans]|uniref:lipopolysaccharide biosynthesis protein n=1 Tax=Metapseudomonas resinovorans TaxID=53412 RepID=UPI00237FB0C2|nr:hypothetical protein [Pseudomonas resinovorans]MDE3740193.1 hypothetical protein [Pseudomonas resinovorans]